MKLGYHIFAEYSCKLHVENKFKSMSSGLWHHIMLRQGINVSKEHAASIFRVKMVLRNVSILLHNYAASQPRRHRLESPSPWKPQISRKEKSLIVVMTFMLHREVGQSKGGLSRPQDSCCPTTFKMGIQVVFLWDGISEFISGLCSQYFSPCTCWNQLFL